MPDHEPNKIILRPGDRGYFDVFRKRYPEKALLAMSAPSLRINIDKTLPPVEVLAAELIRPLVLSVGGMEIEQPTPKKT